MVLRLLSNLMDLTALILLNLHQLALMVPTDPRLSRRLLPYPAVQEDLEDQLDHSVLRGLLDLMARLHPVAPKDR